MAIYLKLKNQRIKIENHSEFSMTAYEYPVFEIPLEESLSGTPYFINEESNFPLKKEILGEKEFWKIPYNENLKPTAGINRLKFRRKNQSDFSIQIHIAPSIFNENDFYQMVQEIGVFALNYQSFTYSSQKLLTSEEVNTTIRSEKQLSTLLKKEKNENLSIKPLEKLITVIHSDLVANALTSYTLTSKIQIFRIEKSNVPQDLIKRRSQPHKRLSVGHHKAFHEDSPENQWLKYIIHYDLINLLEKIQSQSIINSNIKYILDESSNEKILGKNLETLKNKVYLLQKHPFFSNITLKQQRPQITTKLLKTNRYSQIYQYYNNIFKSDFFQSFKISQQIQKVSKNLPLENLSEIYEIWCLSVIYHSLCQLGFKGDALYHSFSIKNHQIKIKNQHKFELIKTFANEKIRCLITYQAKINRLERGKYYTPDIKIDITAPKRKYGLESFSIILDPKYKNFPLCNEKNNIITEVLNVAMSKYHQQLEVKPHASFILHPISDEKFHWLGEEPLFNYLNRNYLIKDLNREFDKYNLQNMQYTSYIAHKFAALPLRPTSVGLDIHRLFTLIFHYHMGLTNLCLCCGRELQDEDEFFINNENKKISKTTKSKEKNKYPWDNSDPSTAFRAVCKSCNNEWRVSFCKYHPKSNSINPPNVFNRIIKIGQIDKDQDTKWFSIHKFERGNGTTCPSCGQTHNIAYQY